MLASVHLPFCKRISHRYWNVNRFSLDSAQISGKISLFMTTIRNFSSQKKFMKWWVAQELVIETDPDLIRMKWQLTGLLTELPVTFLDDLRYRLNLKSLQYLTCLLTRPGSVTDLILHLQR